MSIWTACAIQPAQPTMEPSPLLTFLAGEFAPAIAGLWPAPHAVFLTAPACRRHLLCLALALADDAHPLDPELILHGPFSRAIRQSLAFPPAGLVRALDRMGETAWSGEDYRRLVERLGDHRAAKVLRHADRISADQVRALGILPPVLLEAGLGRLGLTSGQAQVMVEAVEAIRQTRGDQAPAEAAARWSGAPNPKALLRMAQEDLQPPVPPPPFAGTPRLRPLRSAAEMRDAASRYENCLAGEVDDAVSGNSAYYEWLEPPGAVVELIRDRTFGWVPNQARLARNEAVAEPVRGRILQDLREMGVHVGRSHWQLNHALRRAADPSFSLPPVEAVMAQTFGQADED
jgi:hypothetical protein